MKKTALLLLLLCVAVWAQTTDFSGTWKMNENKSSFGQGGPGGPGGPGGQPAPGGQPPAPGGQGTSGGRSRGGFMVGQLTITQADGKLVMERKSKNREGEDVTTTETFTLDGKECVNESRMGEKTTICKWSEDGKKLTMESLQVMNREGESVEMKSMEVYSLEDGVLIIESTRETPRGERKMKVAYDKI
jgi:hypothetical protein